MDLPLVFDFLQNLIDSGLTHSPIRVYLVALSAYHNALDSYSSFFHPLSRRFLQGLLLTHPPVKPIRDSWDLPLVLCALTRHPFEPAATCELRLLAFKTLLLVAITSARRVGKLAALDSRLPYLSFLPYAVCLGTNRDFLPKVVSAFLLQADNVLSDFYPNPSNDLERLWHSLDVTRALKFYLDRTRHPNRDPQLFVSYATRTLGKAISPQWLLHWLVELIKLCYLLSKSRLPAFISAHSTRAVSTSPAIARGVPLSDICESAMWSTPTTFIQHYALDMRAKRQELLGCAVLQSSLRQTPAPPPGT